MCTAPVSIVVITPSGDLLSHPHFMASIHLDEAHDTCNSNVSNPPQGGTAKSASERLAIDPFNAKLIKFPSDLRFLSGVRLAGKSPGQRLCVLTE